MGSPRELLGRFVKPGDLVFDIGAHEGKHTAWMLELGARVVAVEPYAAIAQRIPLHPNLTVLTLAISDHTSGMSDAGIELHVAPGHEYVSTVERDYLEKVQTHAVYEYEPHTITVSTMTLDALIAAYGVPAFCKVDVEGHERAVFSGLTTPLPALSFEVHDFDLGKADDVIARLGELGEYRYQFSSRESFELEPWPARVDIFGDVYAELVSA